jgi:hypothetical protein
VQGDVIRLVALDLVLRLILAGVVDVAFVVHILRVHFRDPATHATSLGIPGHVIADLEGLGHCVVSVGSTGLNDLNIVIRPGYRDPP